MAKEVLYSIEFEGATEQLKKLADIRAELDKIAVEQLKSDKADKVRTEELKIASKQQQDEYRKTQQAIKDQANATKAVSGSLEDLRIKARQYTKELEKLPIGTKAFSEMANKAELVNRQIRNADKSAGNFKTNIGNYAGSIGDAFQGVGLNVGKLTGTLGAATAATGPLGIGLAALVGGAQLFGSAIQATDKLSDAFAITIEKAKTATQVFFKALANGDFSSFISDMRTAINAAEVYAKIMDDLDDRNRALDIQDKRIRSKILDLQKIVNNVNLPRDVRINAATEILDMEADFIQKRKANANKNLEAIKEIIGKVNKIDKNALADIIENYDLYEKQIENVERLNRLENDLRKEKAKAGGGASGFEVVDQAEIKRLTGLIDILRKATASYSDNLRALANVSKEERDKLGKAIEESIDAEVGFKEKTLKIDAKRNKLIKGQLDDEEELTNIILSDAQRKQDAIDKTNKEYERQVKLLKEIQNLTSVLSGVKPAGAIDYFQGDTGLQGYNTMQQRTGAGKPIIEQLNTDQKKQVLQDKFSAGEITRQQYEEGIKLAQQQQQEANQMMIDSALTTASQFVDIWQTAYTQQSEARMAALQMQYSAGLISEKQYNKAIAKERTEQAKKEKAAAIVKAIIGTAQSIVQTGATMGYPLAIPFQILAGIIGAAEIALIATQPVPQYAKGGIVVGGKSHTQGGTKYYGEDGNTFEAERDEVITVVNKHDSGTLRSLSNINSRHGRSFYTQPSSSYFADGGMFSPNQNIGSGNTEQMLRNIVKQVGSIPVEVSLNEIERKSSQKRKVEVIGAL